MRARPWLQAPGRGRPTRRGSRLTRGSAVAVAGAAGSVALVLLTGCAKMDAALARQWIVVDFSPGTSAATALHVREACSHVQNAPPMALPVKRSAATTIYGIRFDTTNASPANVAELQTCLQKFPAVQGVVPQDTADEGS